MTATMERPPTETIPQRPEEELVSVVFKLCSLTSHCLQITLNGCYQISTYYSLECCCETAVVKKNMNLLILFQPAH